jgi:hypothetical protein
MRLKNIAFDWICKVSKTYHLKAFTELRVRKEQVILE